MAFIKGVPRPPNAGRKKGSKNKRTVAKVSELLADKNINPAEEILRLMPYLEPKEQVSAWLDLQSYCEAKPKQVQIEDDMEVDEDEFEELTSDDLLKIVRESNEAG